MIYRGFEDIRGGAWFLKHQQYHGSSTELFLATDNAWLKGYTELKERDTRYHGVLIGHHSPLVCPKFYAFGATFPWSGVAFMHRSIPWGVAFHPQRGSYVRSWWKLPVDNLQVIWVIQPIIIGCHLSMYIHICASLHLCIYLKFIRLTQMLQVGCGVTKRDVWNMFFP